MPKRAAKPLATVAAIGSAVVVGVLLWARRRQIVEKIDAVSEQITEAGENMTGKNKLANESTSSQGSALAPRRRRRTQAEIAQEALTLKQLDEAVPVID